MPSLRSTLRALVLSGLLVASLASCGSNHSGAPVATGPEAVATNPPGPIPGLPSPASLERQAAATDYDRWKQGNSIDTQLPGQKNDVGGKLIKQTGRRVSAYSFSQITFTPTWDPAVSAKPADMAFAGYTFGSMDTYAGTARIELGWGTAPNSNNLWIALADYQTNSWKWFATPVGGGAINLGSFAPYLSPQGALRVLVLVLGTAEAKMDYILAGDPIDPQCYLNDDLPNDQLTRVGPLTVNYNCTGCFGVGSTIATYDFDFDGDTVYDEVGNLTGLTQHVFAPGDYTTTLRVTDNLGHTGTDTESFHVINPANMAPTALFTPGSSSGAAPLTVNFEASASTDSDGAITKYEWDFDNDGVTDYSSATPTASYTFALKGSNPVTLKVTDNDLAVDTYLGQVTCTNGWHVAVAATGVKDVYSPLTSTVVGSAASARACVAYFSNIDESLHFVHGANNTGTSWDAPVTAVAGNISDIEGYCPSMITENVSQVPAIAYGSFTSAIGHTLKYVSATTSTGAAWNAPVAVSAEAYLGEDNCLGQFNNKLTIATFYKSGYQGHAELRTYQATNANGTTWGAPVIIAEVTSAGEQLEHVRMLSVPAGSPVMVWAGVEVGAKYYGCTASSADGSAWGSPFMLASTPGMGESQLSLCLASGRPALALGDTSSDSSLYFARSDNSQGSVWSSPPQVVDTGKSDGGYCTMALVGGMPAIAYYESGTTAVKYVSATAADGSAWNSPMIVDSAGYNGQRPTLAVLPNNVPLVIYYDATAQKIKSAAFF